MLNSFNYACGAFLALIMCISPVNATPSWVFTGGKVPPVTTSCRTTNVTIAGGTDGIAATTDNISWTKVYGIGEESNVSSVTCDGPVFTAITQRKNKNILLTSIDGFTWTEAILGLTLAYAGKSDVVWTGKNLVGFLGSDIFSSPDGNNWTLQTSGVSNNLNAIEWTGSNLVAVGDGGVILTSLDGVKWVQQVSGVTSSLSDIVWSGSKLAVISPSGEILISNNGVAWQQAYSNPLYHFRTIASNGLQFIVTGTNTAIKESRLITSSDGLNWSLPTDYIGNTLRVGLFQGYQEFFTSMKWDGTQFVGILSGGFPGAIFTSTNGTSWSFNLKTQPFWMSKVAWGAGTFVALDLQGRVHTSPDGTNWTLQNIPNGYTNIKWGAIIYAGGKFTAVGTADYYNGILVTNTAYAFNSVNGVSWSINAMGIFSHNYSSIAWVDGMYVAVGLARSNTSVSDFNAIANSNDGVSWIQPLSWTVPFYKVTWGNGRFVITGAYGTLISSSTGTSWQGDRLYVSIGDGTTSKLGAIYAGADGYSMVETPFDPSITMTKVDWFNGQFIATNGTQTKTSSDGKVWVDKSSSFPIPYRLLHDYVSNGTVAIMVSKGGGILKTNASTLPSDPVTSSQSSNSSPASIGADSSAGGCLTAVPKLHNIWPLFIIGIMFGVASFWQKAKGVATEWH